MEYIPVISFVVALLALIGMGINKLAEKVSENPKRLLVAVVVALFVFVFLGSLAYAEESEWQGATVNGAEVEEPEPIWFPSFLLMGLIAPIEKKFKRAQKMPPDFYLPCGLFDKNTYVVYFTEGKKYFVKAALPEALKYITRAESKNIAAFVCTYVEEYKQQAVVACSYCDFLEYWRNTTISDRIKEAHKLTVNIITNNIEPKLDTNDVTVISKEDDQELYAPSPEEIAEFEAMREAYSPGGYRDF